MKEADYNRVAKYYDDVIGIGFDTDKYLKEKIKRYNKNVRSVLELGCGTGNNLLPFAGNIELTGIDISEEMLKIARKKVPRCSFYRMDIREFSLDNKFDLIICLYDTLNHLLLFSDWKKLFINVSRHLNAGGLFIFDINTLAKLEYFSAISPFMHEFNSGYLIVNVKKIFRNTFNWNLMIFENKKRNQYTLLDHNIKESSFETEKVSEELAKHFNIKRIEDEKSRKAGDQNERVFFVCIKK